MKTTPFRLLATIAILPSLATAATYQDDVAFLKRHTGIVELADGTARVAIEAALP